MPTGASPTLPVVAYSASTLSPRAPENGVAPGIEAVGRDAESGSVHESPARGFARVGAKRKRRLSGAVPMSPFLFAMPKRGEANPHKRHFLIAAERAEGPHSR